MKKLVCLLLVLVLVFAMSAGAFAETVISPENGNADVMLTTIPSLPRPVTPARSIGS